MNPDIAPMRTADHGLRQNSALLEDVFSSMHIMVAYLDPKFNFIRVNRAYAADDGLVPDDFVGKNHFTLYPDSDNETIFRRVLETGEPHVANAKPFVFSSRHERGVTYWDWTLTPVKNDTGQVAGVVLLLLNVTERVRADAEMRKLSSAMEQTADIVIITDCHGVIEYVNRAFEVHTGYGAAEALGLTPRLIKSEMHDARFYHRLWTTIQGGNVYRGVITNRHKNGNLYSEEMTITPLRDANDTITHFVSSGKDITERMRAQERLQFLAHHDALTELPNRLLFMDRLSQALNRAQWHQRAVSVMFLDLDRFKNINDTLGHDVGDRFLTAMAERLRDCVRDGDTVARLGGDEFAILLEDIAQPEDVSIVGTKILKSLGLPLMVDERELFVTVSIGISLFPEDGSDAPTLLKHADAAMYRAKELGRNNFQFYSAELGAQAFERLTLETSLRRALERQEFLLSYQPEVDLKSGRVTGLEALLRWRHPDLGMVSPQQFIVLAEETGLIVPIGEWILRAALTQARIFENQGLGLSRIAINISGRQFAEPGFVATVQRILNEIVLHSTQIQFEITESVIMQDAQISIDRLRALHKLGVQFAIDDFGTGYSSLSYLRRFPVQALKIDRSFVQDITTDQDDAEIVKTIIAMAHGLRLQVIAEGVETAEELTFLRSHDCDMAQGYYLGRPIAPEEAGELLRLGNRLPAD